MILNKKHNEFERRIAQLEWGHHKTRQRAYRGDLAYDRLQELVTHLGLEVHHILVPGVDEWRIVDKEAEACCGKAEDQPEIEQLRIITCSGETYKVHASEMSEGALHVLRCLVSELRQH